jgi:Putative peptidoglycan binding domain
MRRSELQIAVIPSDGQMNASTPFHSRNRLSTYLSTLGVLCLIFLCSHSFSQNSEIRSATQKAEDRQLEESFNEIRRDPGSWARSLLDSQQALARFGYGTLFTAKLDDRTKEALRSYQGRNHLTATGDLDFATWQRIQRDEASVEADIPIGPMYLFNDQDWDNLLTAQGIWLEQGKEPTSGTPLKTTRIECFKPNKVCVAATHGATLITIQYLNVARWDKFEIETEPDDLPCGREYIQINRSQKTVLTVNTAAYKNEEACRKLFGPPGKPMVSRLADDEPLLNVKLKALREARDRILVIPSEAKERVGQQNH